MILSLSILGLSALTFEATATDLPVGLIQYLKKKDWDVRVRFDGLITFPNGMVYLPVLSQDPNLSREPREVVRIYPENAKGKARKYPDYIQFDNNLFLVRLVKTSRGQLTTAPINEYPIELKEGMLPQDLVLPKNLYIPAQLKVILGDLPYNPTYVEPTAQTNQISVGEALPVLQESTATATVQKPQNGILYVANLADQSVLAIDPNKGSKRELINFSCVPSGMAHSNDGELLYITCLTSNELVVVDVASNLVKTRIPVGQKPNHVLPVEDKRLVVVSNRFSEFLSLVGSLDLFPGGKIDIERKNKEGKKEPGRGGVMAYSKTLQKLIVADAVDSTLYVVDLDDRKVTDTLPGVENMSALWIDDSAKNEDGKPAPQLWLSSRSDNKVAVVDLKSGDLLHVLEVGGKPVDFAVLDGNTLVVVSAKDDVLEVIDIERRTLEASITLDVGAFPSGVAATDGGQYAFVTTAGNEKVYRVDVKNRVIDQTLPVTIRGTAITFIGPSAEATANK